MTVRYRLSSATTLSGSESLTQPLHSPVLVDKHQPLNALRGSEGLCCLQTVAQDLSKCAQYRHNRLLRQNTPRLALATRQVSHKVRHCMQTCRGSKKKETK